MYYAHTLPGQPPAKWQPLEEHLLNVAHLAQLFASEFEAGEWGYLAGLWHDLGKFSSQSQEYLLRPQGDYHADELRENVCGGGTQAAKVDHTSAGAQHAVSESKMLGHLLAYPIAGHHAGLLNGISENACLEARLKKKVYRWDHGLLKLPPVVPPTTLPEFLQRALGRRAVDPAGVAFSFAFFVRMLFSCLVDADFLDTERFMDPERHSARPRWPKNIFEHMVGALDRYVQRFGKATTPVDEERRRVRKACLDAASEEPGFFSLTVPTGGGKTLSSLAFALRHARCHGLRRIVYVIPFTSIIEQNADVFRQVFAPLKEHGLPDPVVEHHSALDAGRETLESRLAAENWDAPLIVTTSVQFYESLFANRPGRCRKLHNLARSVIILDEAQKLPVDYLHPCLLALRELAANYGASVVLCTATQPAVERREDFPIGLEGVREIVPDTPGLYTALKRVEIRDLGSLGDEDLAEHLLREEQVLCIVNTRRHARELYEKMKGHEGVIHLSAAMCPAHRTVVLDEVRNRLHRGQPCRVVSTQLVEAGVDVDFPVVFRSLAGLDAIAQAAGRCNRNGRLAQGTTYVFRSEHRDSERFLLDTAQAADQLLSGGSAPPLYDDPLSLDAVEHYFRLYYWSQQQRWDSKDILGKYSLVNRRDFPFLFSFRNVANRFRIIEDSGEPVIVPWGDKGRELCHRLREGRMLLPDARLLRNLQRYAVQVPRRTWQQHCGGNIELLHDRYPVLVSPELHYDEELGLVLDRQDHTPETFLI